MEGEAFSVRPAGEGDVDGWIDLYEAVAAEGKWIGGELPVDRERQRRRFVDGLANDGSPATALVAEAEGRQVGQLFVRTYVGIGDLGMAVDAAWRGRGVGSALLTAAVGWAEQQGLHKLTLQVWPHNAAAIGLYEKFGFVTEGHMRRHYRRRSGELWDAVIMGRVLDETSPGSAASEPRQH
jgi:RimJ/RimL family protein N-acetyltransferase